MDSVTAVLVTRGDVDMRPVVDSLPPEWEKVVWDNTGWVKVIDPPGVMTSERVADLSVYGRYAAIEYATGGLIYVQDDDCIVGNPQELVDVWAWERNSRGNSDFAVCNMPQEFLPHYPDSALVGFGAVFRRDLPQETFDRWWIDVHAWQDDKLFRRCCDVVFTALSDRVVVDVAKTDREMASDPNRMWKQPGHISERNVVLNLARAIRGKV